MDNRDYINYRNYFIFDGVSSLDFDTYISGKGIFTSPEPDYRAEEVPGLSGDLHFDNDRYKNVSGTYDAFIIRNFKENFTALKTALLRRNVYCRLEDTYFPGQFRLARVKSAIEPTMVDGLQGGSFTIEFDCKPQRFLKSGEDKITLSVSGLTLFNNGMPSKPLIKVNGYGSGNLTFGGRTMKINDIDGYTMLDCELQNAYKGTENRNQKVTIPVYSTLLPGDNKIVWSGGIKSVEITPRWWVL